MLDNESIIWISNIALYAMNDIIFKEDNSLLEPLKYKINCYALIDGKNYHIIIEFELDHIPTSEENSISYLIDEYVYPHILENYTNGKTNYCYKVE